MRRRTTVFYLRMDIPDGTDLTAVMDAILSAVQDAPSGVLATADNLSLGTADRSLVQHMADLLQRTTDETDQPNQQGPQHGD